MGSGAGSAAAGAAGAESGAFSPCGGVEGDEHPAITTASAMAKTPSVLPRTNRIDITWVSP